MDKLEGFWDPLLLPPDTPAGQRAAVTAGAGRVAVGAGAGTGKTWVLSSRYARLLLTDAECLPRDILSGAAGRQVDGACAIEDEDAAVADGNVQAILLAGLAAGRA